MMGPHEFSVTFAEKAELPLLQAADLLAWQATKRIKDEVFNKRKTRKDFLSLMEHKNRHGFCYVITENNRTSIIADFDPAQTREDKQSILNAMFRKNAESDGVLMKFQTEKFMILQKGTLDGLP